MTLHALLERAIAERGNSPAVRFRRNNTWMTQTYAEFGAIARRLSAGFATLGIRPRSRPVALVAENSPEWMETYLAITGGAAAVVPIDCKLRASELEYILKDSEACAVVTDRAHIDILETILPRLPCLAAVVLVDGDDAPGKIAGRTCVSLRGVLHAKVPKGTPNPFDASPPEPDDVASIIYTSGTTGKPKGAMLTHGNFVACSEGCFEAFERAAGAEDDFLIVLPLFHAFSFTTNFVIPIMLGATMSFVQNLRTVASDLKTLRCSVLMAVPLLAEKMYAKIESGLRQNWKARLLMRTGLGGVVGRQIVKGLGGRLRFIIAGGAPCPVPVITAFRKLGIPLIEGYGLTECAPVVSITHFRSVRIGTIGRALPNIEVRIADKDESTGVGELQVKGPTVMKGYYNLPEATKEAFDGEWLRTGDLATMDADGYITICGRKKALIVNREGKNIYPEEVENCVAQDPLIADVVVVGYTVGADKGEHVGLIATPNVDGIIAANDGQEPEWEAVEKMLRERIIARVKDLATYKHPRKIVIRRDPLERTSIGKVRRVSYQGSLNEPPAN